MGQVYWDALEIDNTEPFVALKDADGKLSGAFELTIIPEVEKHKPGNGSKIGAQVKYARKLTIHVCKAGPSHNE